MVQPKTSAANAAATINRPNFDWDIPVIVNKRTLRFSRQTATSQLHHQIGIFTRPHQYTHQKNIPEIDRVTSVITPQSLEIFRDKSLQ